MPQQKKYTEYATLNCTVRRIQLLNQSLFYVSSSALLKTPQFSVPFILYSVSPFMISCWPHMTTLKYLPSCLWSILALCLFCFSITLFLNFQVLSSLFCGQFHLFLQVQVHIICHNLEMCIEVQKHFHLCHRLCVSAHTLRDFSRGKSRNPRKIALGVLHIPGLGGAENCGCRKLGCQFFGSNRNVAYARTHVHSAILIYTLIYTPSSWMRATTYTLFR